MRESSLRVTPATTSSRERAVPVRRRRVSICRPGRFTRALFHSFGSYAQLPKLRNDPSGQPLGEIQQNGKHKCTLALARSRRGNRSLVKRNDPTQPSRGCWAHLHRPDNRPTQTLSTPGAHDTIDDRRRHRQPIGASPPHLIHCDEAKRNRVAPDISCSNRWAGTAPAIQLDDDRPLLRRSGPKLAR